MNTINIIYPQLWLYLHAKDILGALGLAKGSIVFGEIHREIDRVKILALLDEKSWTLKFFFSRLPSKTTICCFGTPIGLYPYHSTMV
jgi:hypothetical protein